MSVICARVSGVLRSSCICWAVKLTTKDTKDTENFVLFFRSAGRLRSGERGLLARSARQLAEHKIRQQVVAAALGYRTLPACACARAVMADVCAKIVSTRSRTLHA